MRKKDGAVVELPSCHGITLEPGERIISHSAGGGGYGPAHERDPLRVLHDLKEGWISAGRARETYGVAILGSRERDDLQLDGARTEVLRRRLERDWRNDQQGYQREIANVRN